MTRTPPQMWRVLAALLIVSLSGLPLTLAGADQVTLSGRIFQADGTTALQSATVRITNKTTGEVLVSAPTDVGGRYEFTDVPAGTYTFEVEVPDGIYQLDRSVRLGDSETASISFTVKPQPDAPPSSTPGTKMSKKKKGGLIAIIVGGAGLIAAAASNNDSNNNASPSVP